MPRRFENNTMIQTIIKSCTQNLDNGSAHSTVATHTPSQAKASPRLATSKHHASSPASESTASSSSSSQRKVVTFHKSVHVKRVDPLSSYTDAEIVACWYTDSESTAMKKDTKRAVTQWLLWSANTNKKKDAAASADDEEEDSVRFLLRGLEHRIKNNGIASQSQRRRVACQIVLMEQRRQKGQGVCLPDQIALAYTSECHRDQEKAHQAGVEDAAVAAAAAAAE
jgi:hypothetical protein